MNKEEIMIKIKKNNFSFEDFSENDKKLYANDIDVMELLISIDFENLEFVGEELLNNISFAKIIVREDVTNVAHEYIPKEILDNRDFIVDAIKVNPHLLLSSKFKEDKSLLIEAINQDVSVFGSLSKKLKEDNEIVEKAIYSTSEWDIVLESLTKNQLSDKKFFMKYLKEAYGVLNYLSEDLRKDKSVLFAALEGNRVYVGDIHQVFLDEKKKEVILKIIESEDDNFSDLPDNIQLDRELISYLLKHHLEIFQNIKDEVLFDKDFIKDNFKFLEENRDILENERSDVYKFIDAIKREESLLDNLEKTDKKKKNKAKI